MKIAMDVHSLGSGRGGNETYYRYLLAGLTAADQHNEYLLLGSKKGLAQLPAIPGKNFHWRTVVSKSPYTRIPCEIPLSLKRHPVDLYHAQFILPPFLKCKTVVAILDIAYEHFPEAFPAYQRLWSKWLIRASARRADHIVTLSEHSRQDIARTYNIPEEKITVTSLGAGDEFFPRDRNAAKELVARQYGIREDFILYLGRLQARKNLVRLVEAYAALHRAGFPHKLVLAGRADFLFQPVIDRVRELRLEQDVLIPGYVNNHDIPHLYSAADLFVFPSLYEGFGLPVIEAMACGVPVVTSRGSSLEEVAGSAALLVDPCDQASLIRAMHAALSDSTLRDHLRRAGLKRSREFSQERTARKTMAVYEALLGNASCSAKAIDDTPAPAGSFSNSL
ncbi:MAG TPA: glycosyltransferase family 1 protein [Terriglobales bacterium]|nr:glycosyltransferase family 1 protein [Terriglobales bacterium]